MEFFQRLRKIEPTKEALAALFIMALLTLGALFLLWGNFFVYASNQQYIFLADSFLQGKLHFTREPSVLSGWADASLFNGKYYWPLGVFPALLVLPYVLVFGTNFMQGYLSPFLSFAAVFYLYKIALKITKDKFKSILLSTAYVFGTAYVLVAFDAMSWYFSHVVATFCLVLSIYYVLVEDKPLRAGVFFTCAFLTRISIILGGLFYILNYFLNNKDYTKRFIKFLAPVSIGIMVFFVYNYLRFGNVFETGYTYQLIFSELDAVRAQGMWSFKHIPMHLFIMFLKGPNLVMKAGSFMFSKMMPSPLGMSIVFTSPILFFILLADYKKKINKISLAGAVPIALFLIGTYGLGVFQYGYRFAFDFQPFLFVILFQVFKKRKITAPFLVFLALSAIFNIVMMFMFFESFKILYHGDFSVL